MRPTQTHRTSVKLSAAAMSAAVAVSAGFLVAHPALARNPASDSVRSGNFSVLKVDTYAMLPTPGLRRAENRISTQRVGFLGVGLSLRKVPKTGPAIVDESIADAGFATATTARSVQLSWIPKSASTTYKVARDGRVIGRVEGTSGYFNDTKVTPNHSYDYIVTPERGSSAQQSWGTHVSVPGLGSPSGSRLAALRSTAHKQLARIVTGNTTTLTWVAFIPQRYVKAPPKPACDYGGKYEFGGDGHGFDWTSDEYRVALNALINWKAPTTATAVTSYPSVQATHVYKTSTGKLVAQKTASSSGLKAKYAGHGSSDIEVAMQVHAANPFCNAGSIDGGATIKISQNGSWSIISGSVKPMPDHLIYLYNNGHETTVWTGTAKSDWCLGGEGICGNYNLTGYTGAFN